MTLEQWLDRIESMHPSQIEMGLERVRSVADKLPLSLSCPVITVAGTNGKGSVCALIESIAMQAGYRVGKFSSPHLLVFNERACIDGKMVESNVLVDAFERVESARGQVQLTYFEFTTLAILLIFSDQPLDLCILEVGLGGRLDAVNLIDADCAVLTCVDIDHVGFLGDTREQIGWEKAHVFRAGRPAICADPVPPATVLEYANDIGADLWLFGRDFNYAGDRQQWSYGGRDQRRNALAYPALRGANQLINASAALAAFESLRNQLPLTQRDVRQGFASVELTGRFQILPGPPTVVLDIAHNPHAAAHLAANLDNMGFFPFTWAVFGVLADKDIDGILAALGDRIDHWLLAAPESPRAASVEQLNQTLAARGLDQGPDRSVTVCDSARAALSQALGQAGENDRIVVFGSSLTVAGVLPVDSWPNR